MIVRAARLADAAVMAAVRAASIRELCSADHHGDEAAISAWVGRPDKLVQLLDMPEARVIVAELDGSIVGLGGLSGDRITLNYVDPAFRFRGVSKAIMDGLEATLIGAGVTLGRLDSTATALAFYQSLGWVAAGSTDPDTGQPMIKRF